MFVQLNPPIPLHVLDKGDGLAIGVIDYGPEHNLLWITAIDATGEIWCAPNPQVRMQGNWSMGRRTSAETLASKDRLAKRNADTGTVCSDCASAMAGD